MVKVMVGLMGSSAASGSTSMSGPEQLRPFLHMVKRHNPLSRRLLLQLPLSSARQPRALAWTRKLFANTYVNEVTLEMHDRLTGACEKGSLTAKQAALRWLMHHSALGNQDGVVLAGSSVEQMEEHLEACGGFLLPRSVVECFEQDWVQLQQAGMALSASV
ncbi:hypothetical protein LTR08_005610 [Meristemomyces frigidus]|nr:hypothetical protein LTR08_005610 [Meristemomyces frigidus]